MDCTPPHDVMGTAYREVLPKPLHGDAQKTTELVNYLIAKSKELLKSHPVNLKRIEGGKDPANIIWPWSPGYKPAMPTLKEMYGVKKISSYFSC